MGIEDKVKIPPAVPDDDTLAEDNIPGNIWHILHDGPDTGQPKEHEAAFDIKYKEARDLYDRKE